MRKLRFYYQTELKNHQEITIGEKQLHHIKHVLRLKVNDIIELFDSNSNIATAKISNIGRNKLYAIITDIKHCPTKSNLTTHIGQVIAKSTAMDFIVQKATELGVTEITPLVGERTNLRKDLEKLADKRQHWENIAISACAQSYRNDIPTIHYPIGIDDWLSLNLDGQKIILNPDAEVSSKGLPENSNFTMLFGAEGGLSDREINLAIHHGFSPINLGPRVLRVETASLAVLSILQYNFGDLK